MSVTIKKRVVVVAKAMVVAAAALAAVEVAATTVAAAVETLVGVLGKPPTKLILAPLRHYVNVIPCLVSHQFFGLVPFVVPPTK
jgi:outer membrane protein TolC